jgi:hypothetical protein
MITNRLLEFLYRSIINHSLFEQIHPASFYHENIWELPHRVKKAGEREYADFL